MIMFNFAHFYAGYCATVRENSLGKINYTLAFYQLVLAIHGCHMLFLLVYAELMPPLVNYAQFNYMFIVGFHHYGNAVFFAFICLAMIHLGLTYRQNVGNSSVCLQNILLHGKTGFFIWNISSVGWFRRKDVKKVLNHLAELVRNSLHILQILNVAHYMHNHVDIWEKFMKNGYFRELWGIAAYTCSHITGLFQLLSAAIIFHIFTTFTTLFMLCMTMLFIKLKQMNRFINVFRPIDFWPVHFHFFQCHNVEVLYYLQDFNRLYGMALFYSNLVILPSNAIMVMLLVLVPLRRSLVFILSVIVAFEIIFVFMMHLRMAYVAVQLHRPTKKLMHIFVYQKHFKNFADQLKLSEYIERFHSLNSYTVCYGKIGKLSFGSFLSTFSFI